MSEEGDGAPACVPMLLRRTAAIPCCTAEVTASEDITRSRGSLGMPLHKCLLFY